MEEDYLKPKQKKWRRSGDRNPLNLSFELTRHESSKPPDTPLYAPGMRPSTVTGRSSKRKAIRTVMRRLTKKEMFKKQRRLKEKLHFIKKVVTKNPMRRLAKVTKKKRKVRPSTAIAS